MSNKLILLAPKPTSTTDAASGSGSVSGSVSAIPKLPRDCFWVSSSSIRPRTTQIPWAAFKSVMKAVSFSNSDTLTLVLASAKYAGTLAAFYEKTTALIESAPDTVVSYACPYEPGPTLEMYQQMQLHLLLWPFWLTGVAFSVPMGLARRIDMTLSTIPAGIIHENLAATIGNYCYINKIPVLVTLPSLVQLGKAGFGFEQNNIVIDYGSIETAPVIEVADARFYSFAGRMLG